MFLQLESQCEQLKLKLRTLHLDWDTEQKRSVSYFNQIMELEKERDQVSVKPALPLNSRFDVGTLWEEVVVYFVVSSVTAEPVSVYPAADLISPTSTCVTLTRALVPGLAEP